MPVERQYNDGKIKFATINAVGCPFYE